ncbi:flagellar biosynthetic protein FliO [Botrimarina hoheduenensis]|uniref:Flagellar biosynthesis protein, FliO n=1 Tax=Botrimarina hoheduenensis TaxID=2528000 RepID=A0A5C5VXM9_9BACT|nr:flagellar biosynthetic protein FliO [Botrimarina hoheduenensis]TWT43194.1 Flagellar biosynthesis protein, FliO [Botrimarina hoheduenensis]
MQPRRDFLCLALLVGGFAPVLAADRDLLSVPRGVRNRPGVSSFGPATLPRSAKPTATTQETTPASETDPFVLQSTYQRPPSAALREPSGISRSEAAPSLANTLTVIGASPAVTAALKPSTPRIEPDETPSSPAPSLAEPGVTPLLSLESAASSTAVPTAVERAEIGSAGSVNAAPSDEAHQQDINDSDTAQAARHRMPAFAAPQPTERVSSTNPLDALKSWEPKTDSLVTAGSGLALVIGLLMVTAWMIRKAQPRSARSLPREVAEVLGRAPLGGRRHAQLLRIGNKLVLVAISPDYAETLCEITDTAEVARLRSICEHDAGKGSSAAFDELFGQMSAEPSQDGFLGDTVHSYDARRLAEAYADTPGGRRYA